MTQELVDVLGRVDVLMIQVDGREHILTFDEVEAILASLEPRIVVPMHYRMQGLEVKTEQRLDLGNIDPWLEGRSNVRRLDGNFKLLRPKDLPGTMETWIFPYSPKVRKYGQD